MVTQLINILRTQGKNQEALSLMLQMCIYGSLRVLSSLHSCLQMDEWHAFGLRVPNLASSWGL